MEFATCGASTQNSWVCVSMGGSLGSLRGLNVGPGRAGKPGAGCHRAGRIGLNKAPRTCTMPSPRPARAPVVRRRETRAGCQGAWPSGKPCARIFRPISHWNFLCDIPTGLEGMQAESCSGVYFTAFAADIVTKVEIVARAWVSRGCFDGAKLPPIVLQCSPFVTCLVSIGVEKATRHANRCTTRGPCRYRSRFWCWAGACGAAALFWVTGDA